MPDRPDVALVTGGGSGIGLAVTRALLDRGFRVAICGRNERRLAKVPASDRMFAMSADVASAADVRRWVAASVDRFGPPGLLVNNAGIGSSREIVDLDDDHWDRVLDINLKGAFLCTREVLPRMRPSGGWIVNIASLAGKRGFAGASAYCASKYGLVGFTDSLLREESGRGIRATAICPGFVDTPMVRGSGVPAEEMIRPEDVASTILYLLDLGPAVAIREIVLERTGAL